eukprot:TRINITY_DN16374_c0_g1_i1.p1 TRINITY_DN16374_c0_g1~~TRINITY_DN16374_c0_g1_i1.p1  ORF type:complete len:213 (-),score=-20.16 TRINITY_DN16374_c0_g1_i1:287-925(-)
MNTYHQRSNEMIKLYQHDQPAVRNKQTCFQPNYNKHTPTQSNFKPSIKCTYRFYSNPKSTSDFLLDQFHSYLETSFLLFKYTTTSCEIELNQLTINQQTFYFLSSNSICTIENKILTKYFTQQPTIGRTQVTHYNIVITQDGLMIYFQNTYKNSTLMWIYKKHPYPNSLLEFSQLVRQSKYGNDKVQGIVLYMLQHTNCEHQGISRAAKSCT